MLLAFGLALVERVVGFFVAFFVVFLAAISVAPQ